MNIKVEQGELRIDVETLINSLAADGKKQIAKLIGADEEAWRQMAEALADPDGYFNGDEMWWMGTDHLLSVRGKLIPLMPEQYQYAAREWQRQLDAAKADAKRYADWAWQMWHAHHGWQTDPVPWPELPPWAPAAREEMRVRDAAPKMLEALGAVEWAGGPSVDRCPFCNRQKGDGHREECKLADAMRAARGEG